MNMLRLIHASHDSCASSPSHAERSSRSLYISRPHRPHRKKPTWLDWLPVLCITGSAFIFNTSEFIPIGLLGSIADSFAMSDAQVGVMMTIYAWVVALASLPLMLYFSHTELKRLLLGVIGLFVLSHIASALAPNYVLLVCSRIGVALAHALFWSIASVMAMRAAPHGKHASALGFVITGSSLAMILGLPLGRMLGLYVDWRATFFAIGCVAFIVGVMLWRVFPTLLNNQQISLKTLPSLRHNHPFMKLCFLTLMLSSAQFSIYSYIEPFLEQVASFSPLGITLMLSLFGLMGVVGSMIFARVYGRASERLTRMALGGMGVCMLLLYIASNSSVAIVLLIACWGLCFTLFAIIFQAQVIASVPEASAVAMSIFSGIFNIGIGSGALLGGVALSHMGIGSLGFVACGIMLLALFICALVRVVKKRAALKQ